MTKLTLEPRLYESVASLAVLQPAWDDLLEGYPGATIFSSLDWLLPWWRAFGNGQQLKVVGFFDPTQRLVALAPLSITTVRVPGGLRLNLLRLMGDGSHDSDNLDLPVRSGYESALAEALLDYLESGALHWDFCQLNTLPGDSPAGCALAESLVRRHWLHFTPERPRLVIDLPSTWDEYRRRLTSKERGNFERYSRRLLRSYQCNIHKCVDQRDLETNLESLFRLHQKRWELRSEPGTFASKVRRDFYLDLSRTLLSRGLLEFWLLDLDGKTVAAQFCLRHSTAVFSLQEGFDPEHSDDRVGFILRGNVIRELIAAGIQRYDFLYGESHGKERWVPTRLRYRDVHFAKPLTKGYCYLRLTNGAGAFKEWLRAHVPSRVWAMLRKFNLRGVSASQPVRSVTSSGEGDGSTRSN